jgi:hypothetical protein
MQAMDPDLLRSKSQDDRYSYLMMFCALMMVRNARASMQSALDLVPLSPRVSDLAGKLAQGHLPPELREPPSGKN